MNRLCEPATSQLVVYDIGQQFLCRTNLHRKWRATERQKYAERGLDSGAGVACACSRYFRNASHAHRPTQRLPLQCTRAHSRERQCSFLQHIHRTRSQNTIGGMVAREIRALFCACARPGRCVVLRSRNREWVIHMACDLSSANLNPCVNPELLRGSHIGGLSYVKISGTEIRRDRGSIRRGSAPRPRSVVGRKQSLSPVAWDESITPAG